MNNINSISLRYLICGIVTFIGLMIAGAAIYSLEFQIASSVGLYDSMANSGIPEGKDLAGKLLYMGVKASYLFGVVWCLPIVVQLSNKLIPSISKTQVNMLSGFIISFIIYSIVSIPAEGGLGNSYTPDFVADRAMFLLTGTALAFLLTTEKSGSHARTALMSLVIAVITYSIYVMNMYLSKDRVTIFLIYESFMISFITLIFVLGLSRNAGFISQE